MAAPARTPEQIRRDIETERTQLADAVDDLRGAADLTSALRGKLPVLAAAAAGAGVFLAGGDGGGGRRLARPARPR